MSSDPDARLDGLMQSFMDRQRRGERPSAEEYAARHPDLAEAIRDVFPALEVMEEFGSVASPATGTLGATIPHGPVPEQLGDFRVLREVGRGGMGIVYEAVQESLGRHVALKVLPPLARGNPTHLERFQREAKAAAKLHHSNIVPVFGIGAHEGVPYYAMQFIRGQTLDAVLKELRHLREAPAPAETLGFGASPDRSVAHALLTGRFEPDTGPDATPTLTGTEGSNPSSMSRHGTAPDKSRYYRSVAEVGAQVADALAYAHSQGVVHRDVKPANLLLDARGTVWVADFGLAKAEDTPGLTNEGDVLGTLRYMAPEQFDGRADHRSDVYSLGVTLYELAALRPAFDDPVRVRLIHRVRQEEPPPPRRHVPDLPRDLETVILKAMAKEPTRRYASAQELADDLRRFLADRPVHARRATLFEHGWRWARRNPGRAGMLTVIASLLVARRAWTGRSARNRRRSSASSWAEA